MNNGSSLSSPSARPPVEQSSSNFNLRVLDDGLLNTGSFSRKSSLAPSDSASQMINDNLKNPPRVPGLWEGVFRVRRIKEEGKRVFRFHCLQPGCKSTFAASSSSTTLTYHIKSKHRDFYQQRSQGKGVDRSSLTQTTLDMSLVPEAKQNKIKAALEWVIGDLLPFSTLDSELFQAMARSNISNMKPPCGATVRDLLLDHRMTLVARLKGLMDRTLVHGAITVDGWSSRSNRTYLEITFHWLDGDFRAHDCALDLQPRPFPHAAADIASFLRGAAGHWNISKSIVSVTSDNVTSMVKAVDIAGFKRVGCFAHCLHDSVKSALDQSNSLKDLVERCHDLSKFFYCSPKMSQALDSVQRMVGPSVETVMVIMDAVTRWNSTLHMIQRLLRLRVAIESLYGTLHDTDDRPARERLRLLRLKESDWETMEEMVQVLSLIEDTTLVFSSTSKGIAASLYPWVSCVQDGLAGLVLQSEAVDSFRCELGKELNRRVELTDMILTASVFHPSFSLLLKISDEQRFLSIKARVREEYTQLLSESNQLARPTQEVAALDDSDDKGRSPLHRFLKRQRVAFGPAVSTKDLEDDELERYFSRLLENNVVDPLLWWRRNKTRFPMMTQLARKYLAIPATSVASERMFSFSGGVWTDKRSLLSDDAVTKIVFCNYAQKCLAQATSNF